MGSVSGIDCAVESVMARTLESGVQPWDSSVDLISRIQKIHCFIKYDENSKIKLNFIYSITKFKRGL